MSDSIAEIQRQRCPVPPSTRTPQPPTEDLSAYRAPWWFDVQVTTCLRHDDVTEYVPLGEGILPVIRRHGRVRHLHSLTTEFTTEFCGLGTIEDKALSHFAADARKTTDSLRFDCLPAGGPLLTSMEAALKSAGWLTQTCFHFGNWFEQVEGLSSNDWLLSRHKRFHRNLLRTETGLSSINAQFSLATRSAALMEALSSYQTVNAASWKRPEIHDGFIPALVLAAGEAGVARIGLCNIDGIPAAAQIWLVADGRATIFKIAYDERYKSLGVGNALTHWMLRRALDDWKVTEIDFGRGDDSYKKNWLRKRRERWALLGYNPRTLAGLALAARHIGGRMAKQRAQRVIAALRGKPCAALQS